MPGVPWLGRGHRAGQRADGAGFGRAEVPAVSELPAEHCAGPSATGRSAGGLTVGVVPALGALVQQGRDRVRLRTVAEGGEDAEGLAQ